MEYEKKYKEALERAKVVYQGSYKPDTAAIIAKNLQKVFPELKESEDERIRKAIIELVKQSSEILGKQNQNNMIAWLEKQGEKESDPRYKYLEELLAADDIYQMAMNDTMVDEAKSKAIEAISKIGISQLLGIEKQGEQKPADKVEPKFRNGQWIVWQDKCYKVNYNGCGYELIDQNGLSTSLEYGTIDENAHLWTIQDAKDGDVLVDVYGNIGIYKSHDDFDWVSYCSLGHNGGFQHFKIEHDNEKTYPATKEQCNLLFSKMKEAGYTFDFEKKEPKKIEQNPAWSEEDERLLNATINTVLISRNSCEEDDDVKDRFDDELNWLKSLKERIKG